MTAVQTCALPISDNAISAVEGDIALIVRNRPEAQSASESTVRHGQDRRRMWFDRIRGGLAPHKMAPSI